MSEADKRRFRLLAIVAFLGAVALTALMTWRAAAGVGWDRLSTAGRPAAEALMMAVVAGLLLAVVLFRPETMATRALRWTSAAWTVVLVVGLLALWQLIWREGDMAAARGTLVTDQAAADAYLAEYVDPDAGARYRVPTGVFLQSFEFRSADNVKVTGFVWQRWAKDIPPEVAPGVVLPEAEKSFSLKEAYRRDRGDAEVIGWYFAATLRQSFDYADYPFDRQSVWLRLWPKAIGQGVLLVPDFASYADTAPAALPGIEQEFVYSGWQPLGSGFSYDPVAYTTDFGTGAPIADRPFPDLFFNFVVERDYFGPLLKTLPFTLAVAGLLFGVMLLGTNDPDLRSRFGLETLGVIATTGALLLTVVLEHNGIRDALSYEQIAYIEVFPFALYLLILLVTANAIIGDRPDAPAFFDYRNNIWPVMLYWPVFVGILFTVTYVVFF